MSQQMIDAFLKKYGTLQEYGDSNKYHELLGAFTVGWSACRELSTVIICPKCGNMIEKLPPGMEEAIRSGDTIKCGNCKSLLLIVIAASKQMLFDVFCQSIGMTGEEYITGLSNEAVRGYLEAAEQRLHLTDGILRDLLANPTPRQLSVLKTLLTPPIGR